MAIGSILAPPLAAQCGPTASKECVRLGGRVIAIENYAQLAAPTFSPPGGTISSSSVTVSAVSGAVIYYTTDGGTPTCLSAHTTTNTLPLTVISGETVKAFAAQTGFQDSAISSATYTIGTSQVTLSPASAVFGLQQLSVGSAPQTFTLSNSGTLAINTAISVTGDFTAPSTNCPSSLAANTNCTISVVFTPTVASMRSGTLTAGGQTASLSGPGANKTLSASSLSFGNQNVGTQGTQTITMNYTGGAPLSIGAISIPTGSPFTTPSNTCGSGLSSGGTCTITVKFTPPASGPLSGALSIADNAAGSLHSVTLSGTGVISTGPVLTLSTTALNFGNGIMGQTSAPLSVTLTNTGNADLHTGSISAADSAEYWVQHNCPWSVPAAGSCIIQVTYTPNIPVSNSQVTILDDAGGPHFVTLSGSGLNQVLPPTFSIPSYTTITPGAVNTITAPAGASIRYTLDGSNPSYSSTAVTATSPHDVTMPGSMPLKAISWKAGMADSTVTIGLYYVSANSLTPNGALLTAGQFFTFVMSSMSPQPDQWDNSNYYLVADVGTMFFPWAGTCSVQYSAVSQNVYLTPDDGVSWTPALVGLIGSSAVLSNSQCTVNLAGSAAYRNGSALTVSVPISFNASYTGTRALYLDPDFGARNMIYCNWDNIQANSVTVTPGTASLYSGQNQQFTANTSANWSLSPQSGSVSGGGAYSAPSSIASAQVVTVMATSQADPTKFATTAVTLLPGIPVDLHLTNLTVFSGSPTYQATHSITADTNVVVGGSANVTFRAGSTITLDPGFRATAVGTGTAFHAVIQ